jgi:hypothetical protein
MGANAPMSQSEYPVTVSTTVLLLCLLQLSYYQVDRGALTLSDTFLEHRHVG